MSRLPKSLWSKKNLRVGPIAVRDAEAPRLSTAPRGPRAHTISGQKKFSEIRGNVREPSPPVRDPRSQTFGPPWGPPLDSLDPIVAVMGRGLFVFNFTFLRQKDHHRSGSRRTWRSDPPSLASQSSGRLGLASEARG